MHASGGAERPGGWVVKLRRGRRDFSVSGAAGHQYLAVLKSRGRERKATNGHAAGRTPGRLGRRPSRSGRERECNNNDKICYLIIVFHNQFSFQFGSMLF